MNRGLWRHRGVRLASAAVALSFIALIWVARAAFTVARIAPVAPSGAPLPALSLTAADEGDATDQSLIDEAVAADPFSTGEGTSPATEVAATPSTPSSAAQTDSALRLIGTVVDLRGDAIVTCQLGSSSPKVLHVGDTIGPFRLRSASPASAVFTRNDGEKLELHIPRPGS